MTRILAALILAMTMTTVRPPDVVPAGYGGVDECRPGLSCWWYIVWEC